jgi:hypothetical protein
MPALELHLDGSNVQSGKSIAQSGTVLCFSGIALLGWVAITPSVSEWFSRTLSYQQSWPLTLPATLTMDNS